MHAALLCSPGGVPIIKIPSKAPMIHFEKLHTSKERTVFAQRLNGLKDLIGNLRKKFFGTAGIHCVYNSLVVKELANNYLLETSKGALKCISLSVAKAPSSATTHNCNKALQKDPCFHANCSKKWRPKEKNQQQNWSFMALLKCISLDSLILLWKLLWCGCRTAC